MNNQIEVKSHDTAYIAILDESCGAAFDSTFH